MYFALSNLFF
jgi:hypothetical protein